MLERASRPGGGPGAARPRADRHHSDLCEYQTSAAQAGGGVLRGEGDGDIERVGGHFNKNNLVTPTGFEPVFQSRPRMIANTTIAEGEPAMGARGEHLLGFRLEGPGLVATRMSTAQSELGSNTGPGGPLAIQRGQAGNHRRVGGSACPVRRIRSGRSSKSWHHYGLARRAREYLTMHQRARMPSVQRIFLPSS
jgi:hypothetical protein